MYERTGPLVIELARWVTCTCQTIKKQVMVNKFVPKAGSVLESLSTAIFYLYVCFGLLTVKCILTSYMSSCNLHNFFLISVYYNWWYNIWQSVTECMPHSSTCNDANWGGVLSSLALTRLVDASVMYFISYLHRVW